MVTRGTSDVALSVNGKDLSVSQHHEHLLAALRDELSLTATKDGCAPSGQCGSCTVLVDGRARLACKTPVDWLADRSITTPEGLDADERDRYARAFAESGAPQCGFCIPGIVMRVKAMLDRATSAPTRDEIARELDGHLCRCTGYVKILDAVEALVEGGAPRGDAVGGIGARGVRYRGPQLTLGDHGYIDDLDPPGLLHAAFTMSDHARAEVVRIDPARARAVPGVVAVLTAADVPGELRVGIIEADWPVLIPEGGRTSYLGDVLAVVVAVDRRTARRAARLVQVDYRPLSPVVDPDEAMTTTELVVEGTAGNILHRSGYRRGDVDGGLAAAAHVVRETFRTQRVEHAFLEPESSLATVEDDGTVKVWSGGQGIWDDRRQIASVLGLPSEQVTVVAVSNGGAFGGKEDMANQAQTALAAWLLKRPVKCTLSREESLLIHPKRHPFTLEYEAGCDETGRLTALRCRLVADSGPYGSVGLAVLEWAVGHASGAYVTPAIEVDGVAVRTNNPVCGAFRGFGANQAQFAMEGVMDRLAEKVGISGWEIRRRNLVGPGSVWGPGQRMGPESGVAARCLEEIRPYADAARAAGKAVGLGLCLKNSGMGDGYLTLVRASLRFSADGTVEIRHCWTEMGQGVHTVATQVVASELGYDPRRIRVVVDTSRDLEAGQTTGSRATVTIAGALADACRRAKADGCRVGVDYEGSYRIAPAPAPGENGLVHHVLGTTFCYAAQLVIIDRASRRIEEVVAVHDVGRAVNPMLCEGQIEGGLHMGLGYALSEEFPADGEGRPAVLDLRGLGILRARDMPSVRVVLLEEPQPDAPYGIKGVGEMGLVPTAAAVASALRDLDGEWRASLPMSREPAAGPGPKSSARSAEPASRVEPLHHLRDLLAPGCQVRAQPLVGSGENHVDLVEFVRSGTPVDRVVVKWRSREALGSDPAMFSRQADLLEHLRDSPVRAPEPRFVDADGTATGLPCIVLTYLPGNARLVDRRMDRCLRAMGAALAELHAVPPTGMAVPLEQVASAHVWSPLDAGAGSLPGMPAEHVPVVLDRWRQRDRDGLVSLHGDYHPGNLLWLGDRISGIVDWDYACVGPPGFDVAHCRADLILLSGPAAADEFLAGYEDRAGPVPDLPVWDLHRALAALPHFELWIPNMSPVGFPIEPAIMRRRLSDFIADAAERAAAGARR